VIAVILIIAIIAASPLGLFFSNESGGEMSLREAMSEAAAGYYENIERIETENPYDLLEIQSTDGTLTIYWKEVLAVFAVKAALDPDSPVPVIEMDAEKLEILKSVLSDMYGITHSVRTETSERVVTRTDPETGEQYQATESVSTTILTIKLDRKSPDDMAAQYGFGRKEKELLTEMLSGEYDDLWAAILAGATAVGGQGDPCPDRIPLGIFSWPLETPGTITSYFGWREDPFTGEMKYHDGIDLGVPTGTRVLAAAGGTVTVANALDEWGGGYGYYVKISHPGGYESLYAHCSAICVSTGDTVSQGQIVAYSGNTGRSKGAHLHFQTWQGGTLTDPLSYFG
jgi:murein DD-endopeptidase MepM/ murein hydrolase activator NlpD